MTLPEFKKIYYMEWTHRLWGRFIGISFVIPAIYFVARRKVSKRMALRLLGIAGLIGFQGFLGWWMVKSGLHDDLFAPGSHPRVSQYRLTAHLGTAFVCYVAMLTNGFAILRSKVNATPGVSQMQKYLRSHATSMPFRRLVTVLSVLVFVTAMSGGLVAGLDAGLIYNSFPYMGEGLMPPAAELFSDFYSRQSGDIWWRNMLENPSTVQFQHRVLAVTTYASIMALAVASRATKFGPWQNPLLRRAIWTVVGFANLQVLLGISTLLYMVPIPLAALHQAGSLALLTSLLWLRSRALGPAIKTKQASNAVRQSVIQTRLSPSTRRFHHIAKAQCEHSSAMMLTPAKNMHSMAKQSIPDSMWLRNSNIGKTD